MGTIADKRLGDFLPSIDAYRPVALAIAAILALVVVVPGAAGDSPSSVEEFSSSPTNATGAPEPTTAPSTSAPAAAPTTSPPSGDDAFTPSSPETPSAPPVTSRPDTTSDSDTAPAPDDASPPTTRDFGAPSASTGSDDEPQPLRIAASGWATVTGGTPLSGSPTDEVPEGTLPVGTRVGQTDKVSFVRLSGDETTLVLAEDADGRRGNAFEISPVDVCPITESGWAAEEAQPMDEAPEYDADNCVAAQQNPDGTWSISLFLFGDPTDERGFALVPSADAPLDFQVTFSAQALG